MKEENEVCGKCSKPKGDDEGCCKCGAPTKYDPSFCEKAVEYVEQCRTEKVGRVLKVNLPKIEGFAKFLGVSRSTVHLWSTEYSEFSDALDFIKSEQKSRLLDYGLSGEYNSTIAKLILSSDHEMRERSDTNVNIKKDGAAELAAGMMGSGKAEPDDGDE